MEIDKRLRDTINQSENSLTLDPYIFKEFYLAC